MLGVQGLERSSCTCLAYVAFSCLARLAPGFDSSGAFTSSDCLEIVYMAVLAAWPTTILHLLVFSIPLGFEIRRCAAARTLGPANDLMFGWTPDFWCGDVRHECAQLWAALTCVWAWSVYAKGPALDPFHAGVVGAVGRYIWLRIRWEHLEAEICREDGGDGVWQDEVRCALPSVRLRGLTNHARLNSMFDPASKPLDMRRADVQ